MQTKSNYKKRKSTDKKEKNTKLKIIKQPNFDFSSERKIVDSAYQLTCVAAQTNPTFNFILPIKKGTSRYNRIGDKIVLKKITIAGYFFITTQVVAHISETTRMILLYDKTPNGLSSPYLDIFKGYNTNGTAIESNIAFQYPTTKNRFKVLYDEIWQSPWIIEENNGVQFTPSSFKKNANYFKKEINCNLPVVCYEDANSGNIADYQTGALLLLFTTGHDVPFWGAKVYMRAEFEDN